MFDEIFSKPFLINVFGGFLGSVLLVIIARLYRQSYKLPVVFKHYRISSRKKQLIKVKNNRHDERHYLYELQKSQNWFIIFLLVFIINFLWLINNNITDRSFFSALIFMFPTFVMEFIWLKKTSYIEDLITYQKGSLEWEKRRQRKNKRRIIT
ncbi:hypothetical protein [Psychrobacter urativorans]|uniref:hypothetical protein n=1 Tax=Psychrobacter urativorans TaxID=45610 RepID=UPI001919AA9E|nr:hypothetical protein [Psychrobacter urativorans]